MHSKKAMLMIALLNGFSFFAALADENVNNKAVKAHRIRRPDNAPSIEPEPIGHCDDADRVSLLAMKIKSLALLFLPSG